MKTLTVDGTKYEAVQDADNLNVGQKVYCIDERAEDAGRDSLYFDKAHVKDKTDYTVQIDVNVGGRGHPPERHTFKLSDSTVWGGDADHHISRQFFVRQ